MLDTQPLRIAVTPPAYDDIGAVLRSMGAGFGFEEIKSQDLCDLGVLSRYQVAFINCSEECRKHARKARAALRDFVEHGGALYVSDFGEAYLREAFPDRIAFTRKGGAQGAVMATVVDAGLREILGTSLTLHFDRTNWKPVESVGPGARIYLSGAHGYEDGSRANDRPLLVSFDQGAGHVVYTTFHNERQLSDKERELLRFLVLKPVTTVVSRATARLVATERLSTEKETLDTIDPGQTSAPYSYTVPPGVSLKIYLNWRGSGATLRLTVYSPDGAVYQAHQSAAPPLGVAVPNAQPGVWRYTVAALAAPHANFPYVLTVATQPGSVGTPAALPSALPVAAPPACPACGRPARPGAKFCATCGARL